MVQEGAEAPAEAASEAVASEAAVDLVVADIAREALVAPTDQEDRTVREALISDGDLALALADGTADPTIMVAVAVLAACSD